MRIRHKHKLGSRRSPQRAHEPCLTPDTWRASFYESVNPPKYVTNLETGYEWSGFQWVVGANNLFNVYPKELPPAQRYIGTALYDGYTGVGINGGYYYTRLTYKF